MMRERRATCPRTARPPRLTRRTRRGGGASSAARNARAGPGSPKLRRTSTWAVTWRDGQLAAQPLGGGVVVRADLQADVGPGHAPHRTARTGRKPPDERSGQGDDGRPGHHGERASGAGPGDALAQEQEPSAVAITTLLSRTAATGPGSASRSAASTIR